MRNGLTVREAVAGSNSTARRSRRRSKRSADPVTPEVYEAVFRRAGGRCEIGPKTYPYACSGGAHWHHRLPLEHGGLSGVSNGLLVCATHHMVIHSVYPHLGKRNGWLIRRGGPAATPVLLPDGRWVLLTGDGQYEEAR
jgi:hypothetical protein